MTWRGRERVVNIVTVVRALELVNEEVAGVFLYLGASRSFLFRLGVIGIFH